MATRTGKSWTYQESATSANMNKHPQGSIGRVPIRDAQTGLTTTETALTGYTVTVDVQGTSRHHRVEATCHFKPAAGLTVPSPNTAGTAIAGNQQMTVRIRKDNISGECIGRAQLPTPSSDVATTITVIGYEPSASGSQTYIVTAEGYGLTTWETTCASTRPGWLTVVDEGPSY